MVKTRLALNQDSKAEVALAMLREDKMFAELCQQFEPHPAQITERKQQLLSSAASVLVASFKARETVDLLPPQTKNRAACAGD